MGGEDERRVPGRRTAHRSTADPARRERGLGARRPDRHESGIPLVKYDDDRKRYARRLDRAEVGLFLTVDYRPNYLPVLEARDSPRSSGFATRGAADVERIATLELLRVVDLRRASTRSTVGRWERTSIARRPPAAPSPSHLPLPALAAPSMRSTYDVEPGRHPLPPNPSHPRSRASAGRAAASRLPRTVGPDQASVGLRRARAALPAHRVRGAGPRALRGTWFVAPRRGSPRTSPFSATWMVSPSARCWARLG